MWQHEKCTGNTMAFFCPAIPRYLLFPYFSCLLVLVPRALRFIYLLIFFSSVLFRFLLSFYLFFFFSLLLLRLLCVCVYHPTNQVERVFRVLKNSVSTLISVLFFLLFQRNAILFFVYYLRARAKIKSRPLHVNKRIALN